jgi:hypothetical protein
MNTDNKTSLGFLETTKIGKVEIFQNGNKFYYFSKSCYRFMPIATKYIKF